MTELRESHSDSMLEALVCFPLISLSSRVSNHPHLAAASETLRLLSGNDY